jgi:hypothetical protein
MWYMGMTDWRVDKEEVHEKNVEETLESNPDSGSDLDYDSLDVGRKRNF